MEKNLSECVYKSSMKRICSMAMFNYQRGLTRPGDYFQPILETHQQAPENMAAGFV
jgi:hypothetical protein